jgi:hypothetical protein
MKAWKMNLRFVALMALICFWTGVGVGSAQAQTPFTYPPFPTTSAGGLQTNGSATIVTNGTSNFLQLTPSLANQDGSAWYTNPAGTSNGNNAPPFLSLAGGFTTTFQIQFTNPGITPNGPSDGIVFIIQNGSINGTSGAGAVAPSSAPGGELGYTGLTNSVAVQFDTHCNPEYADICNTGGNNTFSTADEISVQSCGPNANTSNHGATTTINSVTVSCSFAALDLTTLSTPIYLADEKPHTATITYVAPPSPTSGSCTPGSTPNSGACGSLTIVLDTQTVLSNVPFSLSYLGLDANDDAYPGFTAATGGGYQVQDVLTWNFGTGTTVSATIMGAPLAPGDTDTANFNTTTGSLNIVTANTPSNNLGNSGGTPFLTTVPTPPATPSALWAGTPLATAVCTPIVAAGGNCAPINEVCTTPTNLVPSGANCPYDTTGLEDVLLSDTYDPSTPITSLVGGDPGVVALNDSLTCPFVQQGSLPAPACPSNGSKAFTGPNQLKTTHGTSNSYYYYVTGILPPAIATPSGTPSGFVTVGTTNWVNGNNPVLIPLVAAPPAAPAPNPTLFYPSPIDYVAYVNLLASATPPDPTLPPFTFPPSPATQGTVVYSPNMETSTGVLPTGPTPATASTCASVTNATTGQVFAASPAYSFPVTANLGTLGENAYSMYYETEDCNRTAERQYVFTGSSPAWVTSYRSLAFNVDDTPPTINITVPAAGGIYPANASVSPSFNCTDAGFDGGSGIAPYGHCNPSSSPINTSPTGGILTAQTFTVTSADNVGNTSSKSVSYSVSCLYATNTINPMTLTRGKNFTFTASITNCTKSLQALTVSIVLSGPLGAGCKTQSLTLVNQLTLPVLPLSKSLSFTFGPFSVPKSACAGPYTFTTTTSNKGTTDFVYTEDLQVN